MNACKIFTLCGGVECDNSDDFRTCKDAELFELTSGITATRCINRNVVISACLNRAGKELKNAGIS
jgi:hypothetical protein